MRVIAPLCVIPPLVPVSTTEYVPGVTPVVEIVNEADPEPPETTLLGLKLTPAPEGKFERLNETFPVNPPLGTIDTV